MRRTPPPRSRLPDALDLGPDFRDLRFADGATLLAPDLVDSSDDLVIGRLVAGVIDEARISPVARSPAWIRAQQRMLDDDGLVTVGDVADTP